MSCTDEVFGKGKVEAWRHIVESAEDGYTLTIDDFTNDLAVRSWLELARPAADRSRPPKPVRAAGAPRRAVQARDCRIATAHDERGTGMVVPRSEGPRWSTARGR